VVVPNGADAVPTRPPAPDAWVARAATGGGDLDLSSGEMRALLERLACRPELAARAGALHPAAGERTWECLYGDAHVDVWVIAWADGASTGWHDHDSSAGALRVIEGTVTEERLRWGGDHERRRVAAGDGLSFGADHVHRVTAAGQRAVSVHAYSPPLRRMGQYSFDDDGALRRRPVSYSPEAGAALAS
jgi:quercetin dioxygenase-like cupin family protein